MEPHTPTTVRLTNLDTGEITDLEDVAILGLDDDREDPDADHPPFLTGGLVSVGEPFDGHGCDLVRGFPRGPVITEAQRRQMVETMRRFSDSLHEAAARIAPRLQEASAELRRAFDSMVAAGIAQSPGQAGKPRRTGRDAQVSPYGPSRKRR